jgi:hypothetical protein
MSIVGISNKIKKTKGPKTTAVMTTDDEGMATETSVIPSRLAYRHAAAIDSGVDEGQDSDKESLPVSVLPHTPQRRPRPRPVVKQKTPDHSSPEPSRSPSPVLSEPASRHSSPPLSEPPLTPEPEPENEEMATPTASRKRQHSADAEDSAQGSTAGDKSPSGSESLDDRIRIRRKRVRH